MNLGSDPQSSPAPHAPAVGCSFLLLGSVRTELDRARPREDGIEKLDAPEQDELHRGTIPIQVAHCTRRIVLRDSWLGELPLLTEANRGALERLPRLFCQALGVPQFSLGADSKLDVIVIDTNARLRLDQLDIVELPLEVVDAASHLVQIRSASSWMILLMSLSLSVVSSARVPS